MSLVTWTGGSGKKYDFQIYPIGTTFKSLGACYIFAKSTAPNSWQAIYIGETSDLSERFDHHHKSSCITLYGATHICVYTVGMNNYIRRYSVERDLLANIRPPCNG